MRKLITIVLLIASAILLYLTFRPVEAAEPEPSEAQELAALIPEDAALDADIALEEQPVPTLDADPFDDESIDRFPGER